MSQREKKKTTRKLIDIHDEFQKVSYSYFFDY